MTFSMAIKKRLMTAIIRPSEITALLDQIPAHIKCLSLDCFDTLLWRKTATPSDVFYSLQNTPPFREKNISARLRAQAEETARKRAWIKEGHHEVKLKDVYRSILPHCGEETLENLAQTELACEFNACYAYPPTGALLEKAHAR